MPVRAFGVPVCAVSAPLFVTVALSATLCGLPVASRPKAVTCGRATNASPIRILPVGRARQVPERYG